MSTPVNERKKKIPGILGSIVLETFVNTWARSMGRRSGLAPIQVANFGDKDAYLSPRAPMTAISCPVLKPAVTIGENHVLLWEAQSYTLTRENVEKLISTIEIGEPTQSQHDHLQQILEKYQTTFGRNDDDIGFCDLVQHKVDLTDYRPIKIPPRR